jgi:hypothetical protein
MIHRNARSGYILTLTLMIISLLVVLITYISFKSSAFVPLSRAMINRQKAYALALSGVHIACAQLAQEHKKAAQQAPEASEKEHKSKNDPKEQATALLKDLLPIKNRWQHFNLKKAADGLNGTISICIVSEEGKLNINQLFDYKKQKFVGEGSAKGDAKKMFQKLFDALKPHLNNTDLFPAFEKFLKERQYKLRDVTELLTIKEFEIFKKNVFYEPSDQGESEKRPVYLTDIFTVWSGKPTVEPWLFSDSISALLGLKRADGKESIPKAQIDDALKKFKVQTNWSTDWDHVLAPLYGKKFNTLPQGIDAFIATTFGPSTFSVLSYGKIGSMTQKVLAIIERTVSSDDDAQINVIIKKIYWL